MAISADTRSKTIPSNKVLEAMMGVEPGFAVMWDAPRDLAASDRIPCRLLTLSCGCTTATHPIMMLVKGPDADEIRLYWDREPEAELAWVGPLFMIVHTGTTVVYTPHEPDDHDA